jgi:hypothetical protein
VKRARWPGPDDENSFWITTEPALGMKVEYNKEPRFLNGNADYAIVYSDGEPETHLRGVEAKKHDAVAGTAIAQCMAYAGM